MIYLIISFHSSLHSSVRPSMRFFHLSTHRQSVNPVIYLPSHPLVCSLVYSLVARSFIPVHPLRPTFSHKLLFFQDFFFSLPQTFIHPFICTFIYLFNHSFIWTPLRSSVIRSFEHSFVRPFIGSFLSSFVGPFIRTFIYSFIGTFIRWSVIRAFARSSASFFICHSLLHSIVCALTSSLVNPSVHSPIS